MYEFIDRTAEKSGTPINRKSMMAMQGFSASTTTFNADGSITQVSPDGYTLTTVFDDDGSVTETFSGEKTIIKKTTFTSNGVSEVIS